MIKGAISVKVWTSTLYSFISDYVQTFISALYIFFFCGDFNGYCMETTSTQKSVKTARRHCSSCVNFSCETAEINGDGDVMCIIKKSIFTLRTWNYISHWQIYLGI